MRAINLVSGPGADKTALLERTARDLTGTVRLAFTSYHNRVEVWQAGRRVYLDQQALEPGEHSRAPGVWGAHNHVSSGVWVGPGEVQAWPAVPGRLGARRAGRCGGAAPDAPQLDSDLQAARQTLRRQLFGAAPLQIRR